MRWLAMAPAALLQNSKTHNKDINIVKPSVAPNNEAAGKITMALYPDVYGVVLDKQNGFWQT